MGKLRAIKVMWHRLICFRTRLRVRLLSGVGRARKCEDKEHAIHCGILQLLVQCLTHVSAVVSRLTNRLMF